MTFEDAARALTSELGELGCGVALVGGLAVSVRAEPRFTRDIDLAVTVDDDRAAERLIRALLSNGYHSLATVEHQDTGRLAMVRVGIPGGEQIGDLLFASSGIEPEVVAAAEPVEVLPALTVPVAQTGHLMALKLLSSDATTRPQDAADLRALVAVASPADRDTARRAVELIQARGYHRSRDLVRAWQEVAG